MKADSQWLAAAEFVLAGMPCCEWEATRAWEAREARLMQEEHESWGYGGSRFSPAWLERVSQGDPGVIRVLLVDSLRGYSTVCLLSFDTVRMVLERLAEDDPAVEGLNIVVLQPARRLGSVTRKVRNRIMRLQSC